MLRRNFNDEQLKTINGKANVGIEDEYGLACFLFNATIDFNKSKMLFNVFTKDGDTISITLDSISLVHDSKDKSVLLGKYKNKEYTIHVERI